jgi:hypothetical protein
MPLQNKKGRNTGAISAQAATFEGAMRTETGAGSTNSQPQR